MDLFTKTIKIHLQGNQVALVESGTELLFYRALCCFRAFFTGDYNINRCDEKRSCNGDIIC